MPKERFSDLASCALPRQAPGPAAPRPTPRWKQTLWHLRCSVTPAWPQTGHQGQWPPRTTGGGDYDDSESKAKRQ
jgi:hypothetical protein